MVGAGANGDGGLTVAVGSGLNDGTTAPVFSESGRFLSRLPIPEFWFLLYLFLGFTQKGLAAQPIVPTAAEGPASGGVGQLFRDNLFGAGESGPRCLPSAKTVLGHGQNG